MRSTSRISGFRGCTAKTQTRGQVQSQGPQIVWLRVAGDFGSRVDLHDVHSMAAKESSRLQLMFSETRLANMQTGLWLSALMGSQYAPAYTEAYALNLLLSLGCGKQARKRTTVALSALMRKRWL